MKVTFKSGTRLFVLEGQTAVDSDGDVYVDGKLIAWFNVCDEGWFVSGGVPGRPSDVVYWDSMVIRE